MNELTIFRDKTEELMASAVTHGEGFRQLAELHDKMYTKFVKILSCSKKELAVYLTSSDPLERQIAELRVRGHDEG